MLVPTELRTWALRNQISDQALTELAAVLGVEAAPMLGEGSESRAQSEIRLAAPSYDMRLFRNNVGALKDERGVPVRYGLANDSKALNQRLKSGDLIGWRRRMITADMVGTGIAQFVSIECKAPGWRYRGDDHEQAQQRWAALVTTDGGFARFATGPNGLA